jgi:hypothetical protein
MRALFVTLFLIPLIASATWPEPKRTLNPPKAKNVVGVSNNALSFYTTDCIRYLITKEQILNFLRHGSVRPFNSDREKLDALAPMTPPENLTKNERVFIERWKQEQPDFAATTRNNAVADGALSTRDGQIIFWRMENDKVLYLATEEEACYLVLEK